MQFVIPVSVTDRARVTLGQHEMQLKETSISYTLQHIISLQSYQHFSIDLISILFSYSNVHLALFDFSVLVRYETNLAKVKATVTIEIKAMMYVLQMINMGKKCPRYEELLRQTLKSNDVEKEEQENKVRDLCSHCIMY